MIDDGKDAMKLAEREEGPAVAVSPAGRLDAAGARVLEGRVSAIVGRGVRRVVLDCGELTYISSSGLRALLVSAKTCLQVGGAFAVAALEPQCRSVVEVSGLLSILDCHETVEAALAVPDRAALADTRSRPASANSQTMAVEKRSEGAAIVLSLDGRLNGAGARVLEGRVAAIVERGCIRVVLDCAGMSYVNSTGLRALLLSARACHKPGGKLVIAALRPECRSVVGMSGFLSIIDNCETGEDALAALARAGNA